MSNRSPAGIHSAFKWKGTYFTLWRQVYVGLRGTRNMPVKFAAEKTWKHGVATPRMTSLRENLKICAVLALIFWKVENGWARGRVFLVLEGIVSLLEKPETCILYNMSPLTLKYRTLDINTPVSDDFDVMWDNSLPMCCCAVSKGGKSTRVLFSTCTKILQIQEKTTNIQSKCNLLLLSTPDTV